MTGSVIPHFGLKRQYNNLREELLSVTDDVLKSGQYLNGNYTRQFEKWLANRCNAIYAVTVHSGTQALEIIARFKYETHSETFRKDLGKPTVNMPNLKIGRAHV